MGHHDQKVAGPEYAQQTLVLRAFKVLAAALLDAQVARDAEFQQGEPLSVLVLVLARYADVSVCLGIFEWSSPFSPQNTINCAPWQRSPLHTKKGGRTQGPAPSAGAATGGEAAEKGPPPASRRMKMALICGGRLLVITPLKRTTMRSPDDTGAHARCGRKRPAVRRIADQQAGRAHLPHDCSQQHKAVSPPAGKITGSKARRSSGNPCRCWCAIKRALKLRWLHRRPVLPRNIQILRHDES